MKRILSIFVFVFVSAFVSEAFAQLPSLKVDICEYSRGNTDEVLEPGFTWWRFRKDVTSDTLVVDGITCVVSLPEGVDGLIRGGWNKSFVQNATYKAQNGRLTGDGVNLEPATNCGEFILTLIGLPKGTHTLQTYHNRWENPANFAGWPISVKVNGELVHHTVPTTMQEPVAANACLLTTTLNVRYDGEPVSISFITVEDEQPENVAERSKYNKTPILNGFELNTVDITAQAKEPNPTDANVHVDADNGEYTLRWVTANANIAQHILYFGTDSTSVDESITPTATLAAADTSYHLRDLYSMNTYWWRVDEVDGSGNVTKGKIWHFRPRQLAFNGAEGYGRYATGGRGGIVYHVTSLDYGKKSQEPGTLYYGLKCLEGPRTIVFDVSGIIEMDFGSIFANPYVTIAAQTAPGKGICLKASNLGIGTESIVRHLRAKRGYGDTGNAMGFGTDQTIIDHTTAAWGTDETVSTRGAKNITFQYSMIAEALGIADHKNYAEGTNHGYAATIDGKIGTYSHNLLVNCEGRNWSMGGGMDGNNTAIGQMDIFNNVCYNWYKRTTDGGCHEVNFVNNYYKMGVDTKHTILFSQNYENIGSKESTWQAYISGNIRENKDHTLTTDKYNVTYEYTLTNGAVDPNTRTDEYAYKTFVDQPFFPSYAVIHSAKDAFKIVTSESGATMPMCDDHHNRLISETINGTYTYTGSRSGIRGEIDHEDDCGGFEVYPEEHRSADYDKDQDGIPGWFESVIGTSDEAANNNADPDHDGWTQLEDYLEFTAHPYLTVNAGEQASIDVAQYFRGFTKTPVFTVAPAEFVQGGYSGSASATIDGSTMTVTGINGGLVTMKVTVTDAENSTYTRDIHVAIIGSASKKGDANNDAVVDVADITAIAAYILGENPVNFNQKNADVNNDEVIDVADITAAAGIILQ